GRRHRSDKRSRPRHDHAHHGAERRRRPSWLRHTLPTGGGRMSEQRSILVLDDDEGVRTQYRWLLSQYKVLTASARTEALEIFERERPALAIVDLGLPPDPDGATEGLATVSQMLKIGPEVKIIVVTGNENREYAVKAIASGAYDFFRKPVDPDLLGLIVDRAIGVYELEQENRRLVAMAPQSPIAGIVGSSPEMLKIL